MQDYVIIQKWIGTDSDRWYTRSEKHKNSNKNKQIKERNKGDKYRWITKNITRCGRSRWWDQ